MKLAKRLFALLLALAMVCAMGITAFAADDPAPTFPGTINITNAEIGKDYTFYKIFDVDYQKIYTCNNTTAGHVHNDNCTYKEAVTYKTNNADLIALIDADKELTVDDWLAAGGKTPDTVVCPFTLSGPDAQGYYQVEHKSLIDENKVTHKDWGAGWIASKLNKEGGFTLAPFCTESIEEGNTLTANVPYGYYLIQPGEADNVIVNSAAPVVNVVNKTPQTPSTPDKTEDKAAVKVGDEVHYTASVLATNYYTESGSFTKKITKYTIKDSYTEGLTFQSIDSVELYGTKNEDGTFADLLETLDETDYTRYAKGAVITPAVEADPEHDIEAQDAVIADADTVIIPWVSEDAEGNLTSLYPSPCYIVIKYTMTVNEKILSDVEDLSEENKIKCSYNYYNDTHQPDEPEEPEKPIDGEPKVYVHALALSLRKVDAANNTITLENAQFKLYQNDCPVMIPNPAFVSEEETPDVPELIQKTIPNPDFVSEEETPDEPQTLPVTETKWMIYDRANTKVTRWVGASDFIDDIEEEDIPEGKTAQEVAEKMAEDAASVIVADNSYSTIEISGLVSGTYYLKEILPPSGYQLPDHDFVYVIDDSGVTEAADGDNFVVTFEGAAIAQNAGSDLYTTIVANGEGSPMPSTGGKGTVALIAFGSMLVLCGGVVLVTKKRMYNAG